MFHEVETRSRTVVDNRVKLAPAVRVSTAASLIYRIYTPPPAASF